MSKVNVFDQEWLDLVFEGRNKEYGAYQLRQQSSRITLIALFSGIALLGTAVSLPVIFNQFSDNTIKPDAAPDLPPFVVVDQTYKVEPPKPVELPKTEGSVKPAPAPRPAAPTTELRPLTATSGHIEKDPPTDDQLKNTNPGTTTDPGTGHGVDTGPVSSNGVPGGTGTATLPDTGTGNEIYRSVDKNPAFPGGLSAFVQLVVNKFDATRLDNITTLRVSVTFVVEKDGSMTDIKVINDPGQGLGQEAIRVLKSIKTKWKPGIKNGKPVRTAYSLPILVNIK